MSGHPDTGGICTLHRRLSPCSVCNSVAIDVPRFPYPAEPTYTVAEIRERVRAAMIAQDTEDWGDAIPVADIKRVATDEADKLVSRAFPEEGGTENG